MAFSANGSSGATAEINVTPLIDVLLVLLIIFMVIVPVMPRGLNSLLPQPPKGTPAPPSEMPIVVQVQSEADGGVGYQINHQHIGKAALPHMLSQLLAGRQEKVMFVRGDRDLQFSSIAEVVAVGHQANADRIGILTAAEEGER